MRIIVTVKQVPDPEAPESSFTADRAAKKVAVAASVPAAVSDYDTYATEVALRVKETVADTTVSVVSLGESHVLDVIKRPLAMGADDLYLVQDSELPDGDPVTVAAALASAIRKIGDFDLILSGRQSSDLDQGIVATALAAILDIPVLTNAVALEVNGDEVQIDRIVDDGIDTVAAQLPALVTVSNEIGQPRYATMRGIMTARRIEPTVWGRADLQDVNMADPFTNVVDLFAPEKSANVEMIEGDSPAEAAKALAMRLREERLI